MNEAHINRCVKYFCVIVHKEKLLVFASQIRTLKLHKSRRAAGTAHTLLNLFTGYWAKMKINAVFLKASRFLEDELKDIFNGCLDKFKSFVLACTTKHC